MHALPRLAAELRRAAEAFNDVTYGERPGTEAGYRMIAELDDHLSSRHANRRRRRRDRGPERLGGGAMTTTAVGPTLGQRWRTIRWVLLTLVVDHRHLGGRAPT